MVFSILASLPTCVVLSIIWTVLFRACWMSSKLGFITIDGISNTISAWKSNQIKPEELTKEERKKGYQMDEKKTENGKKRNTKWHCYWQCCLQSTFHMHGMHFITKRIKRQYLHTYGSGYQSSWGIVSPNKEWKHPQLNKQQNDKRKKINKVGMGEDDTGQSLGWRKEVRNKGLGKQWGWFTCTKHACQNNTHLEKSWWFNIHITALFVVLTGCLHATFYSIQWLSCGFN